MIRDQFGTLLQFSICGIAENVFHTAFQNYFGYRISDHDLPKRGGDTLSQFMYRATWRKKRKGKSSVFIKYKHRYPHIHALEQCGNKHIATTSQKSSDLDALSMVQSMLMHFDCGVLKKDIADTFRLFYGQQLHGHNLQKYFDQHLHGHKLYTFWDRHCTSAPVTEDIYISPIRLEQCLVFLYLYTLFQ